MARPKKPRGYQIEINDHLNSLCLLFAIFLPFGAGLINLLYNSNFPQGFWVGLFFAIPLAILAFIL